MSRNSIILPLSKTSRNRGLGLCDPVPKPNTLSYCCSEKAVGPLKRPAGEACISIRMAAAELANSEPAISSVLWCCQHSRLNGEPMPARRWARICPALRHFTLPTVKLGFGPQRTRPRLLPTGVLHTGLVAAHRIQGQKNWWGHAQQKPPIAGHSVRHPTALHDGISAPTNPTHVCVHLQVLCVALRCLN